MLGKTKQQKIRIISVSVTPWGLNTGFPLFYPVKFPDFPLTFP